MSRRIARRNAKKALLAQQEEMEAAMNPEEVEVQPLKSHTENKNIIPNRSDYHFESNQVLKLFKSCFEYMFMDQELLNEEIQHVKQSLFDRDYLKLFGSETNRAAYVVRWSPARALLYSSLFVYLQEIKELITDFSGSKKDINILCVGGGAGSELVALASCFCKSREVFTSSTKKMNLKLVDIADWSSIVEEITDYINETWIYKEHITESVFDSQFIHADILDLPKPESTYPSLDLITLLFTTNELFKEDKTRAINFLHTLNKYCSAGCLLLVTESAGSYSDIQIGSKKFPIQFLVDLILCGKPEDPKKSWEIVDQNDSIWYRLENDLEYDLKLENMRCFYRLYRKL